MSHIHCPACGFGLKIIGTTVSCPNERSHHDGAGSILYTLLSEFVASLLDNDRTLT